MSFNGGLECPLCFERYDEDKLCPRVLSCGHTCCTPCLTQLHKNDVVVCPLDRTTIPVPGGVDALVKNFALLEVLLTKSLEQPTNVGPQMCETCGDDDQPHEAVSRCLECDEPMCAVAARFHSRSKLSRDHRVVSLEELKANPKLAAVPVFCVEHNEPFRFFDQDCGHVVCRDCVTLKHNGHKCTSLADAVAQCRVELTTLADKANATAAEMKAAEEHVMTVVDELDRKRAQAAAEIHTTFQQAHATLETREQALVTELNQHHKAKTFILTQQRELLHTFQACMVSASDRVARALQSPGDAQLLVTKTDISATVMAMENQPPPLEPRSDAALEFTIDQGRLLQVLTTAGTVSDRSTHPTTTTAEGVGLEEARPGDEATFTITARDGQGALRGVGGDRFVVELHTKHKHNDNDNDNDNDNCNANDKGVKAPAPCPQVKLTDNGDGTYAGSYVIDNDNNNDNDDVGDMALQLSVRLRGDHINGSPFDVGMVTSDLEWDAASLSGNTLTINGNVVTKTTSGHAVVTAKLALLPDRVTAWRTRVVNLQWVALGLHSQSKPPNFSYQVMTGGTCWACHGQVYGQDIATNTTPWVAFANNDNVRFQFDPATRHLSMRLDRLPGQTFTLLVPPSPELFIQTNLHDVDTSVELFRDTRWA